MTKETAIQLFEPKQVRSVWDEEEEKWYFSIVDVISILSGSVDPKAYWRKLKQRLKQEGNQSVTDCHALKMVAADGKLRLTDVADTEQLFRPIQSTGNTRKEIEEKTGKKVVSSQSAKKVLALKNNQIEK